MRTVDPEIWTKKVKKRVPSSLASFFMRNSKDNITSLLTTREKIFRKSVRDVVKEFFQYSSIAGSRIIVDERRNTPERISFCLLILIGILAAAYIALSTGATLINRPIGVTMETMQLPPTEFPFPAVALCSVNLISRKAALNFTRYLLEKVRKNHNHERFHNYILPKEEEIYEWVRRVGYLFDYQLEDYVQLQELSRWVRYNGGNLKDGDILKQLEPTCEDLLVRCSWHGSEVDCMQLFRSAKTAYGHCCTFNYVKIHHLRGLPYDIIREPYTLTATGIGNGLSVIVNNDINDYAYQKQNTIGTNVVIFNSMDYPDQTSGSLTTHMTLSNRTVYLDIVASVQYSAWQVRLWSLQQRGCRFRSELPQFHGHYSYSECLTACKLRTALNLCHCAPFNLPSGGHTKCSFNDIPCLHKHKEKFFYIYPNKPDQMALLEESQNSLFCPECWPDCETVRYNIRHHVTRSVGWTHSFRSKFLTGVNITNKTIIHLYYSSDDHFLYKMDIALDWFELVSLLGNVSYLFAGISVFSVLELIYFSFYRFFVIWSNNKRRFYNKTF